MLGLVSLNIERAAEPPPPYMHGVPCHEASRPDSLRSPRTGQEGPRLPQVSAVREEVPEPWQREPSMRKVRGEEVGLSGLRGTTVAKKKREFQFQDRPGGCVTVVEAAKIAGLVDATIRRWIWAGQLHASKARHGNIYWIKETDLHEAIKNRKEAPRVPRDPTSLSPNEAAEILNVTGEAVKLWIYKGWLKATKLPNGYWRIKHEDLKSYLESRQDIAPAVYVATNSESLAQRLSALASALGHEAKVVPTGAEALKQFPSAPANLLVVDLASFPDAWKLIRKVRGTSEFGSPKILLLVKEPLGEKETGDALRLGINGCLVGEITDAVLGAEMKGLLGKER